MPRHKSVTAMLAAWMLVLTIHGPSANAALIFWTGGASGNFQNANNWDYHEYPGSIDYVFFHGDFANAADVTVTFTNNVDTLGLSFTHITATFNMAGHSFSSTEFLNMANSEFTLNDGTLTAMTATIDSGSLLTVSDDATLNIASAIIGGAAGSSAQIDVEGEFNSSTSIILGNSGTGELNVGHDGTDSTGVGGAVNASVLLLGAANGGQGTINLGENATLHSDSATVGAANNSNGQVNVGDGATWTNTGAITLGALGSTGGTGTISVDDGGFVHTQNLNIGNNGTVTQLGTGGIVISDTSVDLGSLSTAMQNRINAGGLFVADNGLNLLNGGVLETTAAFIDGFNSTIKAGATVTGGGSLLDIDGQLIVGGFNSGSLTVSGGGRIDSADGIIGERTNGNGAITVSGHANGTASQWNIDGDLTVGDLGAGTLNIFSGGFVGTTGDAAVGASQGSTGSVLITGAMDSGGGNASTLDVGGDMGVGVDLGLGAAASQNNINATLTVSNGGQLIINNGAGSLAINESGHLSGNGMIDGHVQLFGRLSPGAPTGALVITGDFETHAGSVLQIQYNDEPLDIAAAFPNLDPSLVDDLLTAGYIAVEGMATLANGTVLNIVKLSGGATPGDTIIVVHAEAGGLDPMNLPDLQLHGAFLVNWAADAISDNGESYLLLTAELDEPALDAFLASLSGNARRVADALAEGELFDVLTSLDPDDPVSGLRTLLPLQHASAAMQSVRTTRLFNNAFFQEMGGLRTSIRAGNPSGPDSPRMFSNAGTSDPVALAQTLRAMDHLGDRIALAAFDDLVGTWGGFLGGLGNWDRVDSSDDRIGYRAQVTGVHGGVHNHIARDLIVGVAAGYLWSELDFRDNFGEGEIDTIRGGPYISWAPGGGALFIDAAASYGYHRNDFERETFLGTARSGYDSHDISAVGQIGYEFAIQGNTFITPLLGAEYTHLRTDSFRERGAGNANLHIDSTTTDSLRLRIGSSIAHVFDLGEVILVPELYAGWSYEVLDDNLDVQSSFIAGGPTFTTRAAGLGRDIMQVSAGLTAMSGTYITFYVRYEGEFQSSRDSHGVVGGIGIRF